MDTETETAIAEAETSTAVNTNTSATEFALRRAAEAERRTLEETQEAQSEAEAEEEVAEAEAQEELAIEEEPAGETETEEQPERSESDDVLSNLGIDLGSLSRDQYDAVAKAIGGRAGERIGELTRRAKTAEEKLAAAQRTQADQDPLAPAPSSERNPFDDLKTVDELRAKASEVDSLIEWAEEVMDDSSQYGPDEEVTTIDGKALTKKEVRDTLKNARKARKEFLPSRLQRIQETEAANRAKAAVAKKAVEDFPWLSDNGNELTARYAEIAGSPEMRKFYADNPKHSASLPYVLAAGVDRIFGKGEKETGEKPRAPKAAKTPLKPPAAPSTEAAASSRRENPSHKAVKELEGRFKKSGRMNDFIKFRTQQHGGQ